MISAAARLLMIMMMINLAYTQYLYVRTYGWGDLLDLLRKSYNVIIIIYLPTTAETIKNNQSRRRKEHDQSMVTITINYNTTTNPSVL